MTRIQRRSFFFLSTNSEKKKKFNDKSLNKILVASVIVSFFVLDLISFLFGFTPCKFKIVVFNPLYVTLLGRI